VAGSSRKRLGEILVEAGAIDETQLRAALGHQRQWGGRLGRALVDLKMLDERTVVNALSRRLLCEVARLDAVRPGPELERAKQLVPEAFAKRHLVLPIGATATTLTVAMADPTNVAAIDELGFRTERRVKALLAGERELTRALAAVYGAGPGREDALEIELDGVAADADAGAFDTSPARFQERFYRSSLRTWNGNGQLVPPPEARSRPGAANGDAPGGALADALQRAAADAEAQARSSSELVAALTAVLVRSGFVVEAELVRELEARAARRAGRPAVRDEEPYRPL
jgi:type IV pilus assembly protein PilB